MKRYFLSILFGTISIGLAILVNSLHRENIRLQQVLDTQLRINNLRDRASRMMSDRAVMASLEQQVEALRAELVRYTQDNPGLDSISVRGN